MLASWKERIKETFVRRKRYFFHCGLGKIGTVTDPGSEPEGSVWFKKGVSLLVVGQGRTWEEKKQI